MYTINIEYAHPTDNVYDVSLHKGGQCIWAVKDIEWKDMVHMVEKMVKSGCKVDDSSPIK